MNNIKKIYQHASKCDYQQNLKGILDSDMVSTPEVFIDNSHNLPMTSTPVKKPISGKSLCLFNNIFDVKNKRGKRRIVDEKSKHRAMKVGTSQWTKKIKRKGIQKLLIRLNVIYMYGSHVTPKLFNRRFLTIVSKLC